jgi:hypothetical protein
LHESYICNLFTAQDEKLLDLSPFLPRAEQFCDLLSGESEISQKLLRKSRILRNQAAGSIGEDHPLEKFLRSTPGLSRGALEDVYLEDRRRLLGKEQGEVPVEAVCGDCFPCVDRLELTREECPMVGQEMNPSSAELRVAGFAVLERLLL